MLRICRKGETWMEMCDIQPTVAALPPLIRFHRCFFPPAAATSDHLKHNSPLSLLPHVYQPLCHLPGPTQVEVQPVLPGQ